LLSNCDILATVLIDPMTVSAAVLAVLMKAPLHIYHSSVAVAAICFAVAATAAEQLCAVGVSSTVHYATVLSMYCTAVVLLRYTSNNFRFIYSQNRSSQASFLNTK
jgi:hypothetical protein